MQITLCPAAYPNLRVLRLWLEDAHGPPGHSSRFAAAGISSLESPLVLWPIRPRPLFLPSAPSYIPSLGLRSVHLFPPATSNDRSPQYRVHEVDCDDFPRLRILTVDQDAILNVPALLGHGTRCPITHLELGDMPYLTCFELVEYYFYASPPRVCVDGRRFPLRHSCFW